MKFSGYFKYQYIIYIFAISCIYYSRISLMFVWVFISLMCIYEILQLHFLTISHKWSLIFINEMACIGMTYSDLPMTYRLFTIGITNFIFLNYLVSGIELKDINLKLFTIPILLAIVVNSVSAINSLSTKDVNGINILFLLITMIGFQDFIAKKIGKTFPYVKFIKNVSPNKTLTGTFSSLILSAIMSKYFLETNMCKLPYSYIISILVLGQFGDLFFSNVKRLYGKKDFGTILGEHGGMLDRLDSLIFPLHFAIVYLEK